MAGVWVAVKPIEWHDATGVSLDEYRFFDSRLLEHPAECAGVIGGPPPGRFSHDGRAWI